MTEKQKHNEKVYFWSRKWQMIYFVENIWMCRKAGGKHIVGTPHASFGNLQFA